MNRQRLSIRNILLLTISMLTLLIGMLAAHKLYAEWGKLANVRLIQQSTFLGEEFIDVIEEISLERDVTYALLRATGDATTQNLHAPLQESRRKADEGVGLLLSSLRQYDFPGLAEKADEWERQFQRLQSLRELVDKSLAMPPGQRDAELYSRWFDVSTELLLHTQDLWMAFTRHFTRIDPIVTQRMMFRHFLGVIQEYAGRERTVIGGLIAANAPATPQDQARLLRWQGVTEQGWKMVEILAERSQLSPAITPYLNDAQSHYVTLSDMVRDIFYIPGTLTPTPYPIDVHFWFELATQATDSLYALKDAARKETYRYVEKLEIETWKMIAAYTAVLLLALGLCCYSFWVIIRHVIRPINEMVAALVDTTQGKQVALSEPLAKRRDEIGQLAQVLHAFQETASELQYSENKLRSLIENALDGVIAMDQSGRITDWNKQAEAIFGWAHEEAVGQLLADLIIPSELQEAHTEGFKRFLATGTGHILNKRIEITARNRRGRLLPVELAVTAQKLHDGYHFSAFIRDITARKEAEAQNRRYMHALERSNKELDDFAYIASHDLKEPLRGIHNHSRFLLEDNQEKLDDDSVGRLNRLVHLSQRMETLVNDLLYFSRLGRQELAIQPTDMNVVIHDIEGTLDLFLAEHRARILIPQPLPTVTCDTVRVTEVFRNLITNAVKYNDNPDKTVEVGFHPLLRDIRDVFYVKDNGEGIAAEFHEEIFRIFKRLHGTKDKAEGTGVGLTFVKKIVERHGGKIWLTSEPGKGSVFYFTLSSGE